MARALAEYGLLDGTARRAAVPSSDTSLDSIRAIVGWTLITVLGFWTPLAIIAWAVAS